MTTPVGRRTLLLAAGAGVALAGTRARAGDPAVVETTGGRVRGSTDGRISSFRGMPYAASTAGPASTVSWASQRSGGLVSVAFAVVGEAGRQSPVTASFASDALWVPKQADARWTYWRPAVAGIVELGTLEGHEVGLPPHFHAEDQLTFVVSGRRRFILGGEVVELVTGQGALIPAGLVHRSLAEPAGVTCINAYARPGEQAVGAMLEAFEHLHLSVGRFRTEDLAVLLRDRRGIAQGHPPTRQASSDDRGQVGQVATRAGMSREAFSRLFARHHGMPPHAFWRMDRLNHARGLLRAGEDVAVVAAETRFADQSHFGRCFLQAFGITPGRYRAGWPRSQTCQTRR